MTTPTPMPLLGVLATLAICPNRQCVRTVADFCFQDNYSDEEWNQIQQCAEERLRVLEER